jgi:LCP family protein required for cell wall assembly
MQRQGAPRMVVWLVALLFIVGGLWAGGQAVPEAFGWANDLSPVSLTLKLLPFGGSNNPSPDAPDWSNKERVNVLVLGIDRRPDEKFDDPVRTDVMMLVSIDPASHSASMLSIPRDLWVPIPVQGGGVLHDRVNTANVYGALRNYPGGGAQLAKETVQYNLGVRVHYYVMLDFDGFEKVIDTVGGIDVHLDRKLIDYEYPTPYYGVQTIEIPAGDQHLDGQRSLWYARSRHQDSDFGRMRRQQEVMMAVREKLLRLDMLPKLPQLWGEFHDAIRTDMSLGDVVNFAKVARDVKPDAILGRTLEAPYVTSFTTQDGAAILLPNRDKIHEVVDETFFDSRKEQDARIEVLNGTLTPGLAAQTATQLKSLGFDRVTVGDAPGGPYKQTQVVTYSGNGYTASLVASLLRVPKDRVKSEKKTPTPAAAGDPVDIRIILGQDISN